jgi:hypothetical protein
MYTYILRIFYSLGQSKMCDTFIRCQGKYIVSLYHTNEDRIRKTKCFPLLIVIENNYPYTQMHGRTFS